MEVLHRVCLRSCEVPWLECDLSVDFLGAVFACGYSGVRVATCFRKTGTFPRICCFKLLSSLQRCLSLRN